MTDEWQTMDLCESAVATWLRSKGLGQHVENIIEATDAESVDDLKLLDARMVNDVVKAAGMKMISAKKFEVAIMELRGETSQISESPSSQNSDTSDAAHVPAVPNVIQQEAITRECIAICIDRSGSMGTPLAEITLNVVKGATKDSVAERTRMEAVKAMFYAFRDRVESIGDGGHQLGLIQFDNQVEQMLDLTSRLDVFESIVDDMQKRGQTAIYSAIVQAVGMLEKQFQSNSQADLRILVLTDGQNNTGVLPEEALRAANRIGAVVDAIIVGNNPDTNLRKIVNATEGECYQISSLGEGFELLECEGVVSLRARRGGAEKPPFKLRDISDFGSLAEKTITRGTAVQRAPMLAPELAKQTVVDVSSIGDETRASNTTTRASMKRILQELKQVSSKSSAVWMHSGEGVHIFPAPDRLNFWRVLIEGPSNSPFEKGVFALNVIIPDEYPFRPPNITFETPIYHCNVSDSGKICLDILQESWSPSLSVPRCLEAIRLLMKNPDTDNSLRQWIAELTLAHQKSSGTDTRYFEKARESTSQNASLTVQDWKQKWAVDI